MKPHFFKVLMGNFSYRLRIPPAFLKNLDESSDKAVLLDLEGGRWNVKINKINLTKVYLDKGWKEFAEYHCLKRGYFLIFKYLGNMQFTVTIFDTTHCSIQYFCNVTKPLNITKVENRFHHNFFQSHSSQKRKSEPTDSSTHASKRGRGRPVKIKEMRTQKTHETFQSKNPFFRKQVKGYNLRKGVLSLPQNFARAHMPMKKSIIELRNGKGQCWIVRYHPGRWSSTFCAGWPAFARGNGLKAGNECIFELASSLTSAAPAMDDRWALWWRLHMPQRLLLFGWRLFSNLLPCVLPLAYYAKIAIDYSCIHHNPL